LEFDSCTCLGSFAIGYAPCSIVFLILGWLTCRYQLSRHPVVLRWEFIY
jgi:hypothetical protein